MNDKYRDIKGRIWSGNVSSISKQDVVYLALAEMELARSQNVVSVADYYRRSAEIYAQIANAMRV